MQIFYKIIYSRHCVARGIGDASNLTRRRPKRNEDGGTSCTDMIILSSLSILDSEPMDARDSACACAREREQRRYLRRYCTPGNRYGENRRCSDSWCPRTIEWQNSDVCTSRRLWRASMFADQLCVRLSRGAAECIVRGIGVSATIDGPRRCAYRGSARWWPPRVRLRVLAVRARELADELEASKLVNTRVDWSSSVGTRTATLGVR